MYFDQLVTELDRTITSGDLTKLTASSTLTSGTPSGAPSASQSSAQAPPPPPPGEKKYKCDQCDQSFSRTNELQSAASLRVHKTMDHGEGSAKMYKCDVCTYSSNREDALTAHKVK